MIFWDKTTDEVLRGKIAELNRRKETDPVVNYKVFEKEDEYLLEFIVSDSSNNEVNMVEENVYRYTNRTINGKNALVLCFYSTRGYADKMNSRNRHWGF